MGKPGVAGTAVGLHDDKPCLVVYLSDKGAERSMPRSVSGFRVVTKMSGGFRKL